MQVSSPTANSVGGSQEPPTKDTVSLVLDLYDSRFDGKSTTQNPYWYANAREWDSFLALDLNKK
jgi:hypothetical protein